ncbi:hypothetical protein [Paenibacillus sacheonensis]|uniref:Uncharacterized protein n=1 Tax=Paenibacillus sacheonensis TaxID=742054 RepID=A0A7X4YLU4_9BACL|nr:hypothetical protein [Paenibacillus sacheonensis]MBM7563444.1 hypothetical protein [Paenibacillus sacheonensis]NBC68001.1 hypothetical protein [Paenibacillus sacheonensis]
MKPFKRTGRSRKGVTTVYYITVNKWITINQRASGNSQINRNIGTYANEGGQNAKRGGKNIQKR